MNTQNMAVSYTSAKHILNAYLFNEDVSSEPFSKATVDVQDASAILSRIIYREAVLASVTMKYSDRDIKLTKENNDLDVLQLLRLLLSVFIDTKKTTTLASSV